MVHIGGNIIEYLESRINELEINSNNKNIKDLYSGIDALKEGTSHELT